MEIGDLLKQSLKDLMLPSYYLKRPSIEKECIVYNYIENPKMYGDSEELASKYTILLNVYTEQGKIEKTKKNVKESMLKNGFKKKIILQPILEQNEIYNIAMQFSIALKN